MAPRLLVVLIVVNSSILIQCGGSESATISRKCDFSNNDGKRTITCTNYTEIPTNIRIPETVKHLYLNDGNHIQVLKNGSLRRAKLLALEYLGLQRCEIRIIERGAFSGGNTLLRIDLNGNMIDTLNPDVFSDTPNLKDLILRNNPLKNIAPGKMFPTLPELITLDLSYCQLDSLSANVFENLIDILNLYLDGNHLKQLDWRMFRKTRSLHILSLEENPWHCDCQVKFLMETLKNLSNLDTTVHLATCASADNLLVDWIGKSWNYAPEDKITCSPKINSFTHASYLFPVQRNENTGNLTVEINEDVYFDCEYSGYPRPKRLWFKDKKSLKQSVPVKFASLPLNSTQISPKIEFQDETSTILQNMEEDEQRNNYNWKERLIVRRVQVQDKGTYECFVQFDNHQPVTKTLYLNVSAKLAPLVVEDPAHLEIDTPTSVWTWTLVGISCGFIILALIVTLLVPVSIYKRRWHREQRGIIKESSIDLGVSWQGNDLTSNATVTVHLNQSYLMDLHCLHI